MVKKFNSPPWIDTIIKYIKVHGRKLGLVFSFATTTYKAFDYRSRYLNEIEVNEILHKSLDSERVNSDALLATYNSVLFNISQDSYQINDIRLPFWYKIYDKRVDRFRMVRFNKAYELKYGVVAIDYFGKYDPQIQGDIGEQWQRNDKIAFESGKVELFEENYLNIKTGEILVGKFLKWRINKSGGSYLYGIQIQ